MASDSEVEEFFDAAEELSPVKESTKHGNLSVEEEAKVGMETTKDDKVGEPAVGHTVEEPVESQDNTSEKTQGDSQVPVHEKPLTESQQESSTCQQQEGNIKESPAPVAPPRTKRKQKKEALAKESSAPPKPPPPRPKNPPVIVKDIASKDESLQETSSQLDNQPRITVNSDTTDMNKVLLKGSVNEVVKNQDLDECKSPMGSKVNVDAIDKAGSSTPVRAPSQDSQLHQDIVRNISSSGRPLSDTEILEQVTVKNLDTGETVPLSLAEEKLPKCINPMALQIMRLTSEYTSESNRQGIHEDENASDSSTAPNIKLHSKRKKVKKFWGKTVQKIKSVADEVKSLRDETSSSDEDDNQDSYYVKIKTHKAIRDRQAFKKIQLLQDLSGEHVGPIWVLKFSICGKLLAAAGQDNIVRVWVLKQAKPYFDDMRAVYAKAEKGSPTSSITSVNSMTSGDDDNTLEEDCLNGNDDADDSGPFSMTPFCRYHGHTSDILDLSWSKNYFILSSSMDKTVRLWHISRQECLCCFQHVDFVTAICFHPRDDRYFLSGSLDGKIRLWNIPEKRVALWNEIDGSGTSLITAGSFCQNGKLAVVGTYDGRCIFYDTERLKYHTQVTVRSSRGKNARGRKISGIEPMPGEDKVLITSNDSRVRLYDLKDHSLFCKYRGVCNLSSQIKASFSPDGKYIVCGSEDNFVYIWRTYHEVQNVRKDRNDFYESFSAHDSVVTAAVFAPIPSLIAAAATSEAKEDQVTKGHLPSEGAHSETNIDNIHVIASADWSGCIKLLINT